MKEYIAIHSSIAFWMMSFDSALEIGLNKLSYESTYLGISLGFQEEQ